jgi:hypothetical protein
MERLLQRLAPEIAAHPADQRDRFRIVQIKEKLGRLTVHPESEATPEMRRRSGMRRRCRSRHARCAVPRAGWPSAKHGGPPGVWRTRLDASREVRVAATVLGEIELMRRLGGRRSTLRCSRSRTRKSRWARESACSSTASIETQRESAQGPSTARPDPLSGRRYSLAGRFAARPDVTGRVEREDGSARDIASASAPCSTRPHTRS